MRTCMKTCRAAVAPDEQGKRGERGISVGGPSSARGCKMFESPGRKVIYGDSATLEAVHRSVHTALRSLVELFDDYGAISPETPWEQIEAMLRKRQSGRSAWRA